MLPEHTTFAIAAASLGAVCAVSASVAFVLARRLLRRCEAIQARVVELAPTEFGAQNFDSVLERNGLRKHLVRFEGTDEGQVFAISSYWWREPGAMVKVIRLRENDKFIFATDAYFRSGALSGAAILAFALSILFWYGPFR